MPKYNRFLIALFSDTHGGHTLGLLNPDTKIIEYDQNGKKYFRKIELGSTQFFLWDLLLSHVAELKKIAGKDDILAVHDGDLSQGNKYKEQLVYSDIYGQIQVAYYNMLPIVELPNTKYVRIIWGTGSHIFQEGSAPRLVYDKLHAEFPQKDIQCVPHGLINSRGVTGDYAHHGPGKGKRNWLDGNEFRYYIKSLQYDEILSGSKPPDLIVRGHNHVQAEETVNKFYNGNKYTTTGLLLPSYDLLSDYARQFTQSQSRVTNGMAVVEVINEKIHYIHWLTKTSDVRVKETIG